MRARGLKVLEAIRSSWWFVPGVLACGALLLGLALPRVDDLLGVDWLDRAPVLGATRPEGARALLSTIASSTIQVAGVVFSVTIAAFVYASSQFGPRLLTTFLKDRGSQLTLGTFVATFLYCLLVLRTIRSRSDEDSELVPEALADPFVPHLSVLVGLALGLLSVAMLIYFIHHVTQALLPTTVIGGIGRELCDRVEVLFPSKLGEEPRGAEPSVRVPEHLAEDGVPVPCDGTGFVQQLDVDGLLRVATRHDLVVRVVHRPGDFVHPGRVLALAWPEAHVDDRVVREVRRCFAWGRRRTPTQDVRFLVDELVQIAARALSPSLNDPFTAMTCMDWLGAGLVALAAREPPDRHRLDDHGDLRVIVEPLRFADLADAVFDQLRDYASADRNAALHLMTLLARLVEDIPDPAARAILFRHAAALHATAGHHLAHVRDDDLLAARLRTVLRDARPSASPGDEAEA